MALDAADAGTGRVSVGLAALNRHVLVAGATGSGKSQTVRHLLEGLHDQGIRWLVIEPAKAEYARMAGRLGAPVRVIRPGDPDAVAWGLNPLRPEPGFSLANHIDLVRELFLAAFDAVDPFPQVLSHALNRCYTDLGWDIVLNESRIPGMTPRYPTLPDLQTAAAAAVPEIGYGNEIAANVTGFMGVRVGSLSRAGTTGAFFGGRYELDLGELMNQNVVLDLAAVGNTADRAFLIGVVLIRLTEYLRMQRRTHEPERLRHVLVIEEAHRLLKRAPLGTPAAHAVDQFAVLLAEIRAYGEGIIVAEQIPSKLTSDVIANTAVKIVHRLPAAEDRDLVGAAMNLDPEHARHVVSLPPGIAIVATDGMDRPVRVAVPLGSDREYAPTPIDPGGEGPLTLREVHRARRIAEDPRIAVWLELLVLAHLTGRTVYRPRAWWREQLLAAHSLRLLYAAAADYIETAVTVRYRGLAEHYPPETLTGHLISATAADLSGNPPACTPSEPHWQAGQFRWVDVEAALAASDLDRPHPETEAWRKRGLHLPGSTVGEQLTALRTHPDSRMLAPEIVAGPGKPPKITLLITRLSAAPAPEQRLTQATDHLSPASRWPLYFLADRPAAQPDPPTPAPVEQDDVRNHSPAAAISDSSPSGTTL
ncbi:MULTISPECIES: ATP-binding protein [unclassified Nocardia]|uniref:ATP-binding protein n=1 Tax=unclassified Nocardia TaxID=2637762 RepID=UPI001CE4A824|nr:MULTISPECIES: ATP-binding protein [unclassified Nocardia]